MTEAIRVTVKAPTERGRLFPRYDADADLLAVGSNLPRACPFGVDIDGNIVFDIDEGGVLANFDLLVPRALWQVVRGLPAYPPGRAADLVFSEATLRVKSFHLPLTVRASADRSHAHILFGSPGNAPSVVSLSASCMAVLDGDRLAGFLVVLP